MSSNRSHKSPGDVQGRLSGNGKSFLAAAIPSGRQKRETKPFSKEQKKRTAVERVQCPECLRMVPVRKSDGKIAGHASTTRGVSCPGAVPTQSIVDLCDHGESPRDQGYNCDCPVRFKRK